MGKARIDLEDNPNDLRRERLVSRAGYALLALIVPLSAAGAFGGGYLWETMESAGGAVMRYQRVVRMYRDFELELSLPAGATVVEYPLSLLDTFEVISFAPAPEHEIADEDGVRLLFNFNEGAQSGSLKLRLRAQKPARVNSRIEVEGQGVLPLNIWVLP